MMMIMVANIVNILNTYSFPHIIVVCSNIHAFSSSLLCGAFLFPRKVTFCKIMNIPGEKNMRRGGVVDAFVVTMLYYYRYYIVLQENYR